MWVSYLSKENIVLSVFDWYCNFIVNAQATRPLLDKSNAAVKLVFTVTLKKCNVTEFSTNTQCAVY